MGVREGPMGRKKGYTLYLPLVSGSFKIGGSDTQGVRERWGEGGGRVGHGRREKRDRD